MKIDKEKYLKKFKITKKQTFEFQEICSNLQKIYGKGIWGLTKKLWFSEEKLRQAHKICKEKGITYIGYLIKVIKNLK